MRPVLWLGLLTLILITPILPSTFPVASVLGINESIQLEQTPSIQLERTPVDVYSMQPVLVFAKYEGMAKDLSLQVTVDIETSVSVMGIIELPDPPPVSLQLKMVPVGWASNWFMAAIPGLPALVKNISVEVGVPPLNRTVTAEVSITSTVSYTLLVNGNEVASDRYSVKAGGPARRIPPLVYATVYPVIEDQTLIKETLGLGPKGWRWPSNKEMKVLIVAIDNDGVADIEELTFEYRVGGGSWVSTPIAEDPLMEALRSLIGQLNTYLSRIEATIREVNPEFDLPSLSQPIFIGNAKVPPQPAGNYILFRANATDLDGNHATSPLGLYYTFNQESPTRVLIIDPHVWLWLYQESAYQIAELLKRNSDYSLPSGLTEDLEPTLRIAQVVRDHGLEPFHHWEYLSEDYDIYIAYPKNGVAELLKTQAEGGYAPNVIILSNLWLGYQTGEENPLNWDLRDLELYDDIAKYIKKNHAGLIATHGTLGDWKIWKGCDEDERQKVGSRGHIGDKVEDVNIQDEKTVSALLGLPLLPLWELARDTAAYTLCTTGQTIPPPSGPAIKAAGLVLGSTPLQVPYVPFNSVLRTTNESRYVGWDIPEEFVVKTPSPYEEFGIGSYTQVGWQLSMPKALAYVAWRKADEVRPKAEALYSRLSELVMNVSGRVVPARNFTDSMGRSLKWGLNNVYHSLADANITGGRFSAKLRVPGLKTPVLIDIDVEEVTDQVLQLLPVKLIALSEDGLAGIVTHDKYWAEDGYRAVYFSFEPEASEGAIAKTLLSEAVKWSQAWEYRDITTLLGGLLRVPKEAAEKFSRELDARAGITVYSDGLILNEGGRTVVEIALDAPSRLHIVVSTPFTGKVSLEVKGARITSQGGEDTVFWWTVEAPEAGLVELYFNADPSSSINPAYVTVKAEAVTVKAEALVARYRFPVRWEERELLVSILSNSSVSELRFDQPLKQLSYRVEGLEGTRGFSNITIPKELMAGPFTVLIDEASIAFNESANQTHTSLHFTYPHSDSARTVKIVATYVIPEFPIPALSYTRTLVSERHIGWQDFIGVIVTGVIVTSLTLVAAYYLFKLRAKKTPPSPEQGSANSS